MCDFFEQILSYISRVTVWKKSHQLSCWSGILICTACTHFSYPSTDEAIPLSSAPLMFGFEVFEHQDKVRDLRRVSCQVLETANVKLSEWTQDGRALMLWFVCEAPMISYPILS